MSKNWFHKYTSYYIESIETNKRIFYSIVEKPKNAENLKVKVYSLTEEEILEIPNNYLGRLYDIVKFVPKNEYITILLFNWNDNTDGLGFESFIVSKDTFKFIKEDYCNYVFETLRSTLEE